MRTDLGQAVTALRAAGRVVVFTGAGISAESGIPTFRDSGGFWERFPPEDFANWSGLLNLATTEPRRFGEFLLEVLAPIADAKPNPAHRAIARLEQSVSTAVVTQNIDGLHQEAGSIVVREVHGTLFEIVHAMTGRFQRLITRRDLRRVVRRVRRAMRHRFSGPRLMIAVRRLAGPDLKGGHRPNVVLFGDGLNEPDWAQSLEAARNCNVLLSVGTSGSVYPAATLVDEAADNGATIINVDPEHAGRGIWLQGTAGEILPALVTEAFGGPDAPAA